MDHNEEHSVNPDGVSPEETNKDLSTEEVHDNNHGKKRRSSKKNRQSETSVRDADHEVTVATAENGDNNNDNTAGILAEDNTEAVTPSAPSDTFVRDDSGDYDWSANKSDTSALDQQMNNTSGPIGGEMSEFSTISGDGDFDRGISSFQPIPAGFSAGHHDGDFVEQSYMLPNQPASKPVTMLPVSDVTEPRRSSAGVTSHGLGDNAFHVMQPQQRRSHQYSETSETHPHHVNEIPSFIALNPAGQNLLASQTAGLDSPLAEYDHDRRRNSNITRARRSRPITQHFRDLIMWRNTKDSAIIFGFGTTLLLSLSHFSLISIFAYLSMITLLLITSFVLLRQITMAFQQQTSEHPFRGVLGKEVVISPEYAHQQLDGVLKPLNSFLVKIRNLYLADSLGQTLKLILFMYMLTYVGAWFNLLTLLTMLWVGAFTVPKLYDTYKEQVDSVWEAGLEGLRDVRQQLTKAVMHQINKIRPPNRRSGSVKMDNPGRIRTQGAANGGMYEAEVSVEKKSDAGGSYEHKREVHKMD